MENLTQDITYLLYWDDDSIPIEPNMTLGNHLENDLVVPGEDVNDYHVRIDQSDRGPVFIPLGEATLNVNGHEYAAPVQVVIGDVVGVGQITIQIGVEIEQHSAAQSWTIHAEAGDQSYLLGGEIAVGRSEDAQISIRDEHISRDHARFVEHEGYLWLQDLRSANGTRVNDVPLQGGCRLFHGDYVAFDKLRYQVIASGEDLTPIKHYPNALAPTTYRAPQPQHETTEFVPVDNAELTEQTRRALEQVRTQAMTQAGAFLLGASSAVEGEVFQLQVGENRLGRAVYCDVIINDTTVSAEHAAVNVRPEGVSIINLMATNGTKVNGVDITSTELSDGDVVRLGRVNMVFKEIPPGSVEEHPVLRRLNRGVLAGTLIVSLLLLLILIF
ncbi:MAG: FHA domain-containing protein [Pseudomonadota bacterium]